jgi:hypothetical protein
MCPKGKRSAMRQLTHCGGSITSSVGLAGSKISARAALKNLIPGESRPFQINQAGSPTTYLLYSQLKRCDNRSMRHN